MKETSNRKNLNKDPSIANKIRVEIENHLKEKYKLFYQKAINEGFTENDLVNVNQFYLKEMKQKEEEEELALKKYEEEEMKKVYLEAKTRRLQTKGK